MRQLKSGALAHGGGDLRAAGGFQFKQEPADGKWSRGGPPPVLRVLGCSCTAYYGHFFLAYRKLLNKTLKGGFGPGSGEFHTVIIF